MSRSCIECVHNNPNDPSDLAYACLNCSWPPFAGEPTNFKPKPITNYDLLRAKSAEEMAEFIAKVQRAGSYGRAGAAFDYINLTPDMVTLWLDWLKQEASK